MEEYSNGIYCFNREYYESDDLLIKFGGNYVGTSKSRMKEGYVVKLISEIPLSVRWEENKYLVSARIKSLSGDIVAELIDNEWEVNPNNYFKRNYDKHGIEIIDKQGVVKIQVD